MLAGAELDPAAESDLAGDHRKGLGIHK